MVKVFLTGGTGFIGSRVAQSLVAGGHIVTALSRRTGTNLDQLNVKILQGTLKDVDAIEAAAADADAVFHLGFEHDFARYPECCKQDVSVVTAIVKALSGSGKLFVNTAGSAADDTGGSLGTEAMPSWGPRAESQAISFKANDSGVQAAVMRLPPFVYAKDYSFFYNVMYKAAQQRGSSCYVGKGDNKMCVAHVDDVASAYVALLSHREARGAFNVPGQNGVTSKEIAEIIAGKLQCKTESVTLEEAQKLFGPIIAKITSQNCQADGSKIKRELGWEPVHTDISKDI